MQFAKDLDAEIKHTIICGDNYMGTNTEAAVSEILGMLEGKEIDLFLAGPAFQAGRYGVACGTICKARTCVPGRTLRRGLRNHL